MAVVDDQLCHVRPGTSTVNVGRGSVRLLNVALLPEGTAGKAPMVGERVAVHVRRAGAGQMHQRAEIDRLVWPCFGDRRCSFAW